MTKKTFLIGFKLSPEIHGFRHVNLIDRFANGDIPAETELEQGDVVTVFSEVSYDPSTGEILKGVPGLEDYFVRHVYPSGSVVLYK